MIFDLQTNEFHFRGPVFCHIADEINELRQVSAALLESMGELATVDNVSHVLDDVFL